VLFHPPTFTGNGLAQGESQSAARVEETRPRCPTEMATGEDITAMHAHLENCATRKMRNNSRIPVDARGKTRYMFIKVAP
jgi:hypothetical protein